jgi:TRAP-type uncharacterized transport system substrate-binding protein
MLGFSRWQLFKGFTAALSVVSIVSLALIYFVPATPSKVIMATGSKGSILDYYGHQYREIFARSGVELELRETIGSVENLKLLLDPNSGVEMAFVIAGVSDAKHAPGLLSLGTVYNNPFWIFYTSSEPLDRLSQLKGKRIAVGPAAGSGARLLYEKVLGKGGVNSENATFLPLIGLAAVEALKNGAVDAVLTLGQPDAPNIHALLQNPNARIMNFPESEAFTILFPELVRVVLPQGVIDIERRIPPNDVALVGPPAKVLVRSDLHPEIVPLMLQAMVEAHSARGVFQRSGEFPNGVDTEYPVAAAATDYYKNGPSYLQRHVPLWLSVHVQRAIAVLVTALAIGYPLFRLMPVAYTWFNRRRLFYWYAQLKALEASFDSDPADKQLARKQAEIERIEDAVSHIQFPLTFSDQVYNLRSHIEIVRHKIASRVNAPGVNDG